MKTELEIKQQLISWIEKKGRHDGVVTSDLNVIEKGIVTSLDIMELILFIEQIKGEKFNLKNIKPGSFNSVNSIYASFFGISG